MKPLTLNTTEKKHNFRKLNLYYFTFLIEFSFNFPSTILCILYLFCFSLFWFWYFLLIFYIFVMVKWWKLKPKFNCVFFGILRRRHPSHFLHHIYIQILYFVEMMRCFEGKSDWYTYICCCAANGNKNGMERRTGTGYGGIVDKKIIEFTRREWKTPAVDGCTRVWGGGANLESARQQTETNYIQQISIFSNNILACNFVFPHLNNYPSNMLFLCYEKHQENYEEKSKIS